MDLCRDQPLHGWRNVALVPVAQVAPVHPVENTLRRAARCPRPCGSWESTRPTPTTSSKRRTWAATARPPGRSPPLELHKPGVPPDGRCRTRGRMPRGGRRQRPPGPRAGPCRPRSLAEACLPQDLVRAGGRVGVPGADMPMKAGRAGREVCSMNDRSAQRHRCRRPAHIHERMQLFSCRHVIAAGVKRAPPGPSGT